MYVRSFINVFGKEAFLAVCVIIFSLACIVILFFISGTKAIINKKEREISLVNILISFLELLKHTLRLVLFGKI